MNNLSDRLFSAGFRVIGSFRSAFPRARRRGFGRSLWLVLVRSARQGAAFGSSIAPGNGTVCGRRRCRYAATAIAGAPMPFDGAKLVFSAQEVLDSALSAGGLEPIEPRCLARHMAEQIRRHPAGWAYRHQRAIELVQVAVLVAGVAAFVALFAADRVSWGSVGALSAFALGLLPLLAPVKGPARWRERSIDDLLEVPAMIREPALRLQRHLPGVSFVVGELYQDRVKLDPYLLAEYREARAILGIWDGNRLIACA
jgi:hypothetical protein